jgi:hypothetical protein
MCVQEHYSQLDDLVGSSTTVDSEGTVATEKVERLESRRNKGKAE